MDEELYACLRVLGVTYILHEHKPVFTVAESHFLKDRIAGVHTKSLFLKDEKNRFYLVCMKGDKRLDMKALEMHLQVAKLHFGDHAELKRELHLAPGSVSVFGMIHAKATKLILDKEVWDAETVSFHPNINTETLELKHYDFEKFYNSLNSSKEVIEL